MRKMGLNEIREKYLSFFESKDHLRLPSFSLVPQNDPSILLINAGMTPLKPYFTGAQVPPAPRVTTCQKCVRTPDIDQVGQTARHGTFFEMLGNFSFGDYFKAEIIPWAWEFCTEVLEMEPERLHVTVYRDDDEAYAIWRDVVGLEPSHITRLGKEDNFWEHGVGPCGPCSEIFFDRGAGHGCGAPDCGVDCDCDRFIEFWNLVFTQFDRQEDGSYVPLAKKNIDTGAGLERIACLMQGVDNLFEVDTIHAVLSAVCALAKVRYGEGRATDVSIRVITDHVRSTTMMVSDGILPSNEGRGYVLRRLLRRAARYGRMLGIEPNFLTKLVPVVIANSSAAYPQLRENEAFILNVIANEEARFNQTIAQGQAVLEGFMREAQAGGRGVLPGEQVFRLHDTFGFPFDLTREIAAEQGLAVDEAAFRAAMSAQKEQARRAALDKAGSAWSGSGLPEEVKRLPATEFLGYDELEAEGELLMLLGVQEDESAECLDEAVAGLPVILIADRTPFYANAGGQTGDRGMIAAQGAEVEIFDCTKTPEGVYLHRGQVRGGRLGPGARLRLAVDRESRMATARNHTATHLLHKALKEVLGTHVNQAGSMVSPERLRFDFNHFQAMSGDELQAVERMVNEAIMADLPVRTQLTSIAEAKASGAMALFDEKYGDVVRVVEVEGFSKELCGGTHLSRSSQACFFKIVAESSVASGVRRIEAVTGRRAYDFVRESERILEAVAAELKSSRGELEGRADQIQKELKAKDKEIARLESRLAAGQADELIARAGDMAGIRVLVERVKADGAEALRELADRLRDRLGDSALVLAAPGPEKVAFIAMLSPEAVRRGLNAGQLVKAAAQVAGGGGGGRPDMAQAGGKDPAKTEAALEAAREAIAAQLKGL